MRSWVLSVFILLGLTTYIPSAKAIEGMALEGGLELPVQIGGRFKLGIVDGIYGSFGLGFSPGFLVDMMGSTSGSLGVVGSATGDLMADSLQDSLYIDARAGYELDNGIYLEGGVSSFQAGGGDTDECTIIDSINDPLLGACGGGGFFSAGNSYTIDASLINLTIHGGYKVEIGKFDLKLEGGLIKPLSADVTVDTFVKTAQDVSASATTEDYLSDEFTQSLWIVSVAAYLSMPF